jgi:anti-sigma regulatory factor (Ser/Thr protein kinase)
MGTLIEAKLSSGLRAASEARALVARLQKKGLDGVLDDVTLLVSELVTNSYRYGGLQRGDTISLTVSQEGRTVRVEVADPGLGGTIPAVRRPTAEGGWGLEIVRRTADRWGARKDGHGTVVWFELDIKTGKRVS